MKTFYQDVRAYFVEAASYIVAKFPINEEWLKEAEVIDVNKRTVCFFSNVAYFIEKLSMKVDMNKAEHQFVRYQVDTLSFTPGDRIDQIWGILAKMYPELSKVLLAVLTVFHGNAGSERVFSAVRHVNTDFRQSMSRELMDALMVVKRHLVVRNDVCYTYKFNDSFLTRAKSATYQALKKHEEAGVDDNDDIVGLDISGQIMRMLCPDIEKGAKG